MEMDPKLIGERIKLAREAKNLTAKGLGEYVGLSEATISRYESGIVAKIKLPVLQELAKRLDVSEEYLFGVSDTPHQKIRIVPQSQYPYVPDAVAAGIPETLEGMSELPKITLPDESLGRYAGRYIWAKTMSRVGMTHTAHECRHTFRSWLDSAGANKVCIDRLMGHVSAGTGERVYTHKTIEELKSAIELITNQ